jgi:hypothetical protein
MMNTGCKNVFLLLGLGVSLGLMAIASAELPSSGQIVVTLEAKATTDMANASTSASKTLGDPFYEESTKSTGIRVLDVSHGPKVEVSFAGNGTINGTIPVTDIGTIWTIPTSPDGATLYSEGQGLLTTEQGIMVTYTQQALGEITSDGRVIFRGSMLFNSPSQTGELDFLNNLVGIYNYESDLAGNAERTVWEWT